MPETLPDHPYTPANRTKRARVRQVRFGDGYLLVAPDGINNIEYGYRLTWTGLARAEAEELDSFFTAHAGATPFEWTPPGETEPLLWTCESWSDSRSTPGRARVSATLREHVSWRQ